MRLASFLLVLNLAAWSSARAETLTLSDCLREVAQHNPLIEQQRANVRVALGTQLTLRSRALPRLNVGLLAGQQGDEGTSVTHPGKIRNTVFGGSTIDRGSRFVAIGTGEFIQPLFDYAIPASWRRGSAEVALNLQNFYAVASATLYQARMQFNQALFYRENGRVVDEISQRLDANVKVVGDQLKAGLAGQQSLLQAQLVRSGIDPPKYLDAGNYQSAVAQLWALMGRRSLPSDGDPLKKLALAGSLADAHPPVFDLPEAAKSALASRPDLENIRQLIRAYTEDAKITRAGYYPNVQLIINGQALPQNFVRSQRPNALRAGDEISTTEARFGARYFWNVIDTGQVQGEAHRIDRLREGLSANLRHLEQDIPRDLATLKDLGEKLDHQAEIFQGNLATADENLKIVTDAVAQGTSSQLEVTDAENGQLNTQFGLLDVQLQAANAQAEFDRILGRYVRWVQEPDPAAARAGRTTNDKN